MVIQSMWGTFGLVAFTVILRSFTALLISPNLGLIVRDKENISIGYNSQTVRDRHAVNIYKYQ